MVLDYSPQAEGVVPCLGALVWEPWSGALAEARLAEAQAMLGNESRRARYLPQGFEHDLPNGVSCAAA